MTEVAKKPCDPMIGADVEAFLYNNVTDMVEACVGILPGTKEAPAQLKGLRTGFAVQEDNVMVEFNIPPATTPKKFAANISSSKSGVRKLLGAIEGTDYDMLFQPSAKFPSDQLTSPQAKLIGCEPDFDAYQGGKQRRGPPPLDNWRGAGGHIHLGGDFQCPDFIAALFADLCIGVIGGLTGTRRSHRDEWYGQPGVYRPKPYGIEYRSPSGQWAASNNAATYAGHYAMRLANWLTKSDARKIQTTFRGINWDRVYKYAAFDTKSASRENTKNAIIEQANAAGVPL